MSEDGEAAGAEQQPAPHAGRVMAAFVRSRVGGPLLMLLVIGGGLLVASGLPVQLMPELDPRRIVVTVPYPGSNPSEIEESITRRIEERVIGIDGVRRVTSRASAAVGVVTLDVEPLADIDQVLDSVRTAVDRIERFPPPDAESPDVSIPLLQTPAISLAVASSELSAMALRGAAERVREDLLALPLVSTVSLDWSPAREIVVEVSEEALREHGLTIAAVAQKLRRSSVDLTSGRLLTNAGGLVLRVSDRRTWAQEFEDVVLVARPSGALVLLGDVAEVRESFGDRRSVTELDGVPAIFVSVLSTPEGPSEIDIARDVRAMLDGYAPPPGAQVSVWNDSSRLAQTRLNLIVNTGILGLVLVFIILVLVFDFRLAMWVALGVPTSFFGALLLFPAFGLTINVATIFALVIVIGIVVDDAVVVGESIAQQRARGLSGFDAAIAGARQVFWPVAVGVTTTLVAFLPLLFTYGLAGQFLSLMPIVVGLVLAVSMAEAFLILPSHLSRGGAWSRWPLTAVQTRVAAALDRVRDRLAVPAIAVATRRPVATLAVAALLVIGAALLFATGSVRYAAMSAAQRGFVDAQLTYPVGTPFEATLAGARQIEEAARLANEQLAGAPIASIATIVGHDIHHGSSAVIRAGLSDTHLASVRLQLLDESSRSVSSAMIERAWRANVGEIAGAQSLKFSVIQSLSGAYDVGLALIHPDDATLARAADDLAAAMEAMPGLFDVSDSRMLGTRHFDLELTQAGAAAGLTPGALATQLRARFFGAEVQRIQRGRDEIKVVVRYPQERRRSFSELADERIELPNGGDMPLAVAARVVESRQFDTLMRVGGVRAVEVGASVDASRITAPQALSRLRGGVLAELQARYPGLGVLATAPSASLVEALDLLAYTVPIALLVMYMLMAVQFRSYVQPLMILTAMPLAAAGAVLAHLLLGYDMNLASIFGVVAVLGVVINDTLLLMARYNSLRASLSLPAIAAVGGAVRQRFRAIAITTVTTIAGLMPVLFIKSEATIGGIAPLVVSIVGGLAAGSIGILFVVPSILLLAEGLRERMDRRRMAGTAA